MALPAEKTRYTFADVLTWDEKERVEIIDGYPVMMGRRPGHTRKPSWNCRPSSTHT